MMQRHYSNLPTTVEHVSSFIHLFIHMYFLISESSFGYKGLLVMAGRAREVSGESFNILSDFAWLSPMTMHAV